MASRFRRTLLYSTQRKAIWFSIFFHLGANVPNNAEVIDIRYAFRSLRLNLGFTLLALAALALGIGVNSAIFSVVHGVLLKPMAYPDADRLVYITRQFPGGPAPAINGTRFLKWSSAPIFESAAAFDVLGAGANVSVDGEPEQVPAIRVTAAYFDTFGIPPAVGRGFEEEDTQPGAAKVAVISDGLWKRRFGSAASILGKTITLAGDSYEVVGIAAPGFRASPAADVWTPLVLRAASDDTANQFLAVGKLRDGVTLAAARAQLPAIKQALRSEYPQMMGGDETIGLHPIREFLTGSVKPALWLLLAAVGLVLLIACANIANLLLARAAGRSKEIAVRLAIGASRGRIIRQLMTENMLLALLGSVLGLVVGSWMLELLLRFSPAGLPRLDEIRMDGTVVVATIGISILTALLFGLAPAAQTAQVELNGALREQGRGTSGGERRARMRRVLIVAEVALCMVLVVCASLLLRSFAGLRSVDAGFEIDRILTFKVGLTPSRYGSSQRLGQFSTEFARRIETIPGVEAAAGITNLPLEIGPDMTFDIEGLPRQGNNPTGGAQWRAVTPSYFRAMQVPLKTGRVYNRNDTSGSTPVIIANDALARRYYSGRNLLGERITIGRQDGPAFVQLPRVVVGIVGDVREVGLDREAPPTLYVPATQVPESITRLLVAAVPSAWVVRTHHEPRTVLPLIKEQLRQMDATIAVAEIKTMEQVVATSISQQRFNALLLTLFAILALGLAVIGIYGVISYTISQRTQEIGIRMALGAGPGETLRMVLAEIMKLAGIGVVLGVTASLAASRLLTTLLFGVSATDLRTYAIAIAAVLAAAAGAALVPALGVLRVDPSVALRYER